MELTAMIQALQLVGVDEDADIYSDSQYVVKTLTMWARDWEQRGWVRASGPVKNLDLVIEAHKLARARPRAHIHWIRGHAGNRWNEYADRLATAYQR